MRLLGAVHQSCGSISVTAFTAKTGIELAKHGKTVPAAKAKYPTVGTGLTTEPLPLQSSSTLCAKIAQREISQIKPIRRRRSSRENRTDGRLPERDLAARMAYELSRTMFVDWGRAHRTNLQSGAQPDVARVPARYTVLLISVNVLYVLPLTRRAEERY